MRIYVLAQWRAVDPPPPLTVNYTVGGTANYENDYSSLSDSAAFGSGIDTVTILYGAFADSEIEEVESVIVTLLSSPYYSVGLVDSAISFIEDVNDGFVGVNEVTKEAISIAEDENPTPGAPSDDNSDDYEQGDVDSPGVPPQFLADPPSSDTLKWSDYKEVATRKKPGIDAETSMKLRASVKVDWEVAANDIKKIGDTYTAKAVGKDIESKSFKSIFEKESSYVVKGAKTAALLAHEVLHLRIDEYIATKADSNFPASEFISIVATGSTKVKAKLEEVTKAAFDKAVDEKLEKFKEKWHAMKAAVHEKYDLETNHGKKDTEQQDWSSKYKQFTDTILKDKGWMK